MASDLSRSLSLLTAALFRAAFLFLLVAMVGMPRRAYAAHVKAGYSVIVRELRSTMCPGSPDACSLRPTQSATVRPLVLRRRHRGGSPPRKKEKWITREYSEDIIPKYEKFRSVVAHMASLIPCFSSQRLMGQAVRKPASMPSCIIHQNKGSAELSAW